MYICKGKKKKNTQLAIHTAKWRIRKKKKLKLKQSKRLEMLKQHHLPLSLSH